MADIPTLQELKKRSLSDLPEVAAELRRRIVETCRTNGGHVGASLGSVELTIALHFVFDSPEDALVWDVGHQAYSHKLLTGRSEQFSTLRKYGGLSGFLSRSESEHDWFGAGHSSTAISAVTGLSWRSGGDWSVAIVGDGALTAGLAFEGLENLRAQARGPVLIVLNDNGMSISPNVGAMAETLKNGRAKEFFESMGLDYRGPEDGHDLSSLIATLRSLRDARPTRPIVLHVKTVKGKGLAEAEKDPSGLHGFVSPPSAESFSARMGKTIESLLGSDRAVVAVTAAMLEGTGLVSAWKKYPDRVIDVGIAEPHAVVFAAGMSIAGKKPIVAIYSTFLQRSIDALIHDVSVQEIPMVLLVDRAGLVGDDGATHHGVFDIVYLSMIPGLQLFAPRDLEEAQALLEKAVRNWEGLVAIRYPRGSGVASIGGTPSLKKGFRIHGVEGEKGAPVIVALGTTASQAILAAEQLRSQGHSVTCISTSEAKPISSELLSWLKVKTEDGSKVVTVEAGVSSGGFGDRLSREIPRPVSAVLGYPDRYVSHGTVEQLEAELKIDSKGIASTVRALLTGQSHG